MATKVGMFSATHGSVTVARGQRQENTDQVKNQSDGRIRYCALKKKINKCLKHMTSFTLVKCNGMIISVVMPSYPNVTFVSLLH